MIYSPNDKLEEALVAVLTAPVQAINASCAVVPGKSSDADPQTPIFICAATGNGEMDPPFSGNFWLTGEISFYHTAVQNEDGSDANATDPKDDDLALWGGMLEALIVDDIADQLTAAVDDFTVFPSGVIFSAPERDQSGAFWMDKIQFRVYCCCRSFS